MIILDHVSRVYNGPPAVRALRDVSLRIDEGDYVAMVGPSGSGKSTMLNLLGLLDKPTSGRIEFDDQDVSALAERTRTALRARRIGFVFQAFHLLNGRTAVENVALGELYAGWKASGRFVRARANLACVGMSHREGSTVEELSGGEKQRVAIARALMGNPRVLLCDEPTGSLDSENSRSLLGLLSQLNESGVTIVIVTHDRDVSAVARRRIYFRDGSVVGHEVQA